MIHEEEIIRLGEIQMKEIGQRIKEARKKAGLSSQELADCIGVCKDQMSRIENGRVVIKTEYLFVLPQCLNISVEFLLYGNRIEIERKEVALALDRLNSKDFARANNILKAVFE